MFSIDMYRMFLKGFDIYMGSGIYTLVVNPLSIPITIHLVTYTNMLVTY